MTDSAPATARPPRRRCSQPRVLFCGIPSEAPLRLVIQAAQRLRIPHLVLNQRYSQHVNLCLDLSHRGLTGTIAIGDQLYPLESFSGVYARLMDCAELPENRPRGRRPPDRLAVERSHLFHEAFQHWMELSACRVLNRNGAMASNVSKPYQMQFIRRCGLLTPPTLVTNSPEEVLSFLSEHGRLIYKSSSSVRSIVRDFDSSDRRALQRLSRLPTQFQAYIPGTNIRVHVVGDRVIATRVETEATDYRYAGRDGLEVCMRPCELPSEIAARCLTVSRWLDLPLCGIDLKRTPSGEFYCFEVNPSPAYSYYEESSGQAISEAIVRYLAA